MTRIVALALASWLCAAPAAARPEGAQQGGAPTQTVEMRVSAQRPRGVLVDRGSVDGLAVGDRVRFRLRAGGTADGRVVELAERSAWVELDDPAATVELGARGEASVPSSRFAGEVERIEPDPEVEESAPQFPEHPPWTQADDEWQEGEPLLAHVVPLHPDERAPSLSGRVWASASEITSSEDDRTDGFERVGTSLRASNWLGRGESIAVDLELNARRTDVPDDQDESEAHLRIDRASYTLGDSRFATDRVELGRFLQRGMPEFGVIDGVEWGRRLSDGDRFGASLGWMPEPNQDYESGHDFQAAAYYRWVFDASEVLSASLGAQKTLHHSSSDRDLAVAKVEYLPRIGWNVNALAWVDYYSSNDGAKGAGLDLTQAYARVARRFEGSSSVAFTYSHFTFPDIDRYEFPPLAGTELADDEHERIAVDWDYAFDDVRRLRIEGGLWSDEDEAGTDGEVAYELRDFLDGRGGGELAVFGTRGRFSRTYGLRSRLFREDERGTWRADYEFAQNVIDEFSNANNELPQHRLRLGRDWHAAGEWNFAIDVEAWFWDQETAFALHVYVQRSL